MSARVILSVVVAVSVGASCARRGPILTTCTDTSRLACTGLYGDGELGGQVAAGIASYEPGFRLWSDGLEKARYVYLPPGARIDSSDPDEWTFPVGTRFWKEFRWRGRRIETRFLEKRAPGSWRRTTFAWSRDGREAREDTRGSTIVLDAEHGAYDIPGQEDCGRCHDGRRDEVLGFEALALAVPGASGETLDRLVAEGRLSREPDRSSLSVQGPAHAREALGWLHMNCGVSCHNPNASAGASFTGLNLKWEMAGSSREKQPPAMTTAVDRPTTSLGFRAPGAPRVRLVPGHPELSALYVRASSRAPTLSMPPLATHLVDRDGLALLAGWIEGLARPGHQL